MTTSHPTRTEPVGSTCPPPDWLDRVADALHELGGPDGPRPLLVGAIDLGPPDHGIRFQLIALDGPDPVAAMIGLEAPSHVRAAGIVSGCRAYVPGVDSLEASRGVFIHLVDRSGTSVTRSTHPAGGLLRLGPTTDMGEGRVADACRRMLGLPTAPPPSDMSSFVVDAWLALVVDAALDDPRLSWAAAVGLHPGRPRRGANPGEVAAATRRFGDELDWDRFRRACAADGPPPCVPLDAAAATWMDAGMFARWLVGEMPPWESTLDLLDGILAPSVSDRLRAAVSLCPSPSWPPP